MPAVPLLHNHGSAVRVLQPRSGEATGGSLSFRRIESAYDHGLRVPFFQLAGLPFRGAKPGDDPLIIR